MHLALISSLIGLCSTTTVRSHMHGTTLFLYFLYSSTNFDDILRLSIYKYSPARPAGQSIISLYINFKPMLCYSLYSTRMQTHSCWGLALIYTANAIQYQHVGINKPHGSNANCRAPKWNCCGPNTRPNASKWNIFCIEHFRIGIALGM